MRFIDSAPRHAVSSPMPRFIVHALAAAGVACALVAPREANALPLLTLSASLRGLYGSVTGDPDLNPFGPGLGVRAGVTLPASLYLGASVDYFFGESESVAGIDTSASVVQFLGNVGYDLGLGPLTLRPNLGFGLAQSSLELGDADESEGSFVLSPGVEAMVGLGLLNVGAELRYNEVFEDEGPDADAVIVGIGLGLSL